MGATVCSSTAPRTCCTFFGTTTSTGGDYFWAGAGGHWSNYKERRDGSMGDLCSSSGVGIPMAVMEFKILRNGLRGSKLTQSATSRVTSNSRTRRFRSIGEKLGSQSDKHRVGSPLDEGLKRRMSRGVLRFRQWRVRAKEDAEENAEEDAEEEALGQEGYWDGAEGKQQLNDIEDMLELIAEAENLKKSAAELSANGGPGELTSEEIEKQKAERAEKLRKELARLAQQQAEQRKQAELLYSMGQRAYGTGAYDKSVEFLEAALSNIPGSSNLGGEIQIWLAMGYDAHSRHGDCIALYKRLEASHPNKQIRRQAADLRYILEAPKLKISKEEMVSIPIIERDYDRNSKSWSQKVRDSRRKPRPISKSKDYLEDWLVWDPPRWERNPYFWVAFTVWLTLVGVSLMFQD